MSTDTLGDYLSATRRYPLLTTTQEIELGRQVQAMQAIKASGRTDLTRAEKRAMRLGQRAAQRMICSNLRLVVSVAKRYARMCQSLELMDCISLGNIGLARAVETFDPAGGYKFSTFAYWWIRQNIMRGMMDSDRMIRVPIHQYEKANKLRRILREQPHLSIEEAVKLIGTTVEDVRRVATVWNNTSLDVEAVDGLPLLTLVPDEGPSVEERAEMTDAAEKLQDLLGYLEEGQREMLELRYGLRGEPQTFAQIGKGRGCTRQAVQQQIDRALRRVKLLAGVAA
jgi:RNA polymerase primary sigma factor